MKMEIEKIKFFVYNHAERLISQEQLRVFPLGILCLLFLGTMFSGFFAGGAYTLVLWSLFLPYMIWFIIKNRRGKKNYADRLLLLGSFSLMLSIFFLILSFIFVDQLGKNAVAYKCGIILCLILALLIYCAVRLNSIKKGTAKKQADTQKRAPSIGVYAGIAVLGSAFARMAFRGVSQGLAIKIAVLLSAGLAMLYLLGIDPLLKYYFCRKYKLDAAPEE